MTRGAAIAATLIAAARVVYAGGLEIPDNGTEALGRGGAFTAKADDATALRVQHRGAGAAARHARAPRRQRHAVDARLSARRHLSRRAVGGDAVGRAAVPGGAQHRRAVLRALRRHLERPRARPLDLRRRRVRAVVGRQSHLPAVGGRAAEPGALRPRAGAAAGGLADGGGGGAHRALARPRPGAARRRRQVRPDQRVVHRYLARACARTPSTSRATRPTSCRRWARRRRLRSG